MSCVVVETSTAITGTPCARIWSRTNRSSSALVSKVPMTNADFIARTQTLTR